MDRHDLPEITAKDVAEAHKQDMEIQDQFDCRALTYWFDEVRGAAFCLVEAPNKQSVIDLHNHSHGMVPGNIIEVDSKVVEAFLGRIKDPEHFDEVSDGFSDPAFRTIMVTELQDAVILKHKLGSKDFYNLLRKSKKLLEESAQQFAGKLVSNNENDWITSFASTSKAVSCALEINRRISYLEPSSTPKEELYWTIGLSAGDPVTKQEDFFGETIQLAKRLCLTARNGQIVVSSLVNNLFKKEKLEELSSHKNIKSLQPDDERFLNNLMDTMEEVWNKKDLTNADLTRKLGLSESQFYRKLSSLTGKTPTEFIKEIRLARAVKLIENKEGNISQIAFETGFNNPSYFSKCFSNRFGILPSTYSNVVN
ncbi:DUF4242 domain-containing protein [Aliifodinibius sp. S!AR15-10]|uniref:nickel-binding protein n=1 Tax=Aliifodinibius sp. S!AR15-10 TaxID=2950437 RepID=UPI00285D04E9|nr:nickel-binding protein [Aliifodinibius sp. S!AR15-10]MDR8392190.1 DUF4242 domain-containing protein [Aliifodinibius sp. S!AR15-10]